MNASFNRRAVLKLAVAGAGAGAAMTLPGCSSSTGGGPKPGGKAAKAAAPPTFKKMSEVKPDLPGDELLMDGFFTYPADPKSVITGKLGDGKPISFITNIPGAIPPAENKNSFWQALNKKLGSDLTITMAPNDEYSKKFATVVAGGSLPDIINVAAGYPQTPQLLQAKCLDLTEHLSGDAVLKYPALASLPTECWKACMFDGRIRGVPVPRLMSRTAFPLYRKDLLDKAGYQNVEPASFDEFLKLSKELTHASSNHWAWCSNPTAYFQEMLGIPYKWKEEGGTFTADYEVPEYKQYLDAARKFWAGGVVNPDAYTVGSGQRKQWLDAGICDFNYDSYVAWNQFYTDHTTGGPFEIGGLDVPGFDGGKGTQWLGSAINDVTAFASGTQHSVETFLHIANYFAAPFGSKEYLFRKFGVEGVNYKLQGTDPVPIYPKFGETGIGLQYICDSYQALYLPKHKATVQAQYDLEKKQKPKLVANPTSGLWSNYAATHGAAVNGPLNDLCTQIILGKKKVADFDAALKTWKSSGGDQMRSEWEAAYAKANG